MNTLEDIALQGMGNPVNDVDLWAAVADLCEEEGRTARARAWRALARGQVGFVYDARSYRIESIAGRYDLLLPTDPGFGMRVGDDILEFASPNNQTEYAAYADRLRPFRGWYRNSWKTAEGVVGFLESHFHDDDRTA